MESNYNIDDTINHLFREESGKMVAVLAKIFGVEHFELAEDVVQDALVAALETWKFKGIPANPRAWLYRAAKNKAIDIIRKRKHDIAFDFSDPERQLLTSGFTSSVTMESFWEENHIKDDFLAMMYACCHPDISPENQITFILKTLCGFSAKEVARAFLTSEDTISKRLYRTKEYFRKHKIQPKIPSSSAMVEHSSSVLGAIYLLFNEGYNSTHVNELIRKDLISQALLLCRSVVEHEKTQSPEAFALMALMCFHTARVSSRLSANGDLVLLANQNRALWDQELIVQGEWYLNKAAFGDKLSTFHLEAAIAYEHCAAKTYEATNWTTILSYYDLLLAISFDEIVFLNRCMVVLELQGAEQAFRELSQIDGNKRLANYYLYYAILGEVEQRRGNTKEAKSCIKKAIDMTQSKLEKAFLQAKLSKMDA